MDHLGKLQDLFTDAVVSMRGVDGDQTFPDHTPLPIFKHTPPQAPPSSKVRGPTFRQHEGNIRGIFWEHEGNTKGTFRQHEGNILGT